MANVTKKLSEEHQLIIRVIEALDRECSALDKGGGFDKDFFVKAVDFIRHYADKFHHAKEEDILFTGLRQPGVQMHCDPTQQMLFEHDQGRKFVRGMEEAVKAGNKAKVIENARGYAGLLRDHIFKEDNILYPMAEEALGDAKSAELAERCRAVDGKFADTSARFEALVREFEDRAKALASFEQ